MRVKGGVRQRGNRWQIRYWGIKPNGERGECNETAATEAEAQKVLEKRRRELANHFDGIKTFEGPNRERVTVAELLDSLAIDYRQREIKSLRHTIGIDGKGGHMKPVRDWFGRMKALAVTSDRIREYITHRQSEGRSNAKINRETEILSRAFRLAVEEGKFSSAPHVPALAERNVRQGFFEKSEVEAVLRELPEDLRDMARFAYLTGWRRGELAALRWESVDRNAREIRIPDSKNGEGRSIPLDDELCALIERRWTAREHHSPNGEIALSPLVFHLQGRPRLNFNRRWRKACERAGCPTKLFHDFRRTAVRDMIRANVPRSVAKAWSGHKTDAMQERYNITSNDDMKDALRLRRAYLDGQESNSNVVRIRN